MKMVVLSVVAMLFQQALATMTPLSISVLGPVVVSDLGLNPGYIGAFAAIAYGTSMIASLMAGGAIIRFGALRVSQYALVMCGFGLAVAAGGNAVLFVLAALVVGAGGGPSTPASSHILARFSPPHLAPLVFSIKQTGVPLGGVLAGTLIPFWLGLVGWQGALLLATSLYLILAVVLQPLRRLFDDDRDPSRSMSLRASANAFRTLLRIPPLRDIVIVHFLFTGLQMTFGSFFVAFMVDGNGFDLAFAGLAFAAGQGAGMVGRILWGWVASRFVSPRLLLGLLGLSMGVAGGMLVLIGPGWPGWAIFAISISFGLTVMSFQGVMLSEVARVAPRGSVGDATGLVVMSAYAGMVTFPGSVGAIVGATGSYTAGFLIAAAATVPAALLLIIRRPRETAAA